MIEQVCTLLLCGLCLSSTATAQVWKYIDANGVTHFTNEANTRGQLIIAADERASSHGLLEKSWHDLPENQAIKTLRHVESLPGYKEAHQQIKASAHANGLDYALVKAVAATESAFNPNAVSHKGAVGLMQIMPNTATQYGLREEPGLPLTQKLKELDVNIQIGTRHLAGLTRMYPGRLDLALAAYNAGQGAVSRAGNQIPNFRETQDYVRKVLAVYKVLQARS